MLNTRAVWVHCSADVPQAETSESQPEPIGFCLRTPRMAPQRGPICTFQSLWSWLRTLPGLAPVRLERSGSRFKQ